MIRFNQMIFTAAGILLGCFLAGCSLIPLVPLNKGELSSNSSQNNPSLNKGGRGDLQSATSPIPISRKFIDPQDFAATNGLKPFDFQGKPIAGVVNHHILAADLMARFFKTLKAARPDIETFVIVSPDHFSRGQGISTNGLTYVTPAGDAVVRKRWVFQLKKTGVWDGTDTRAFEQEHGVGALVPFIVREFPGAKILPIFLRADLKPEQTKKFGEDLAKLVDDKTFVVISSDMSHYLKEADALRYDAETIRWLQQDEWDKLSSASDKNTDSAPAFDFLSSYFANYKVNFSLLSHKISTDYGADPNSTTSYILGFWTN